MAEGTQHWIVLLFALAFFVKAPLFPLHGWVPETYRSTPIVTLALLSGVLSKVGVYGFLRIVLPVMPEGAQHWQELFIVVAVFSILYGSILAFSQDNVRLVVAYSSIAQLGFIVLGIFAFEQKGAQGAVFQMLNHGLVVVPLFLIIGVIAARARGSESLSELGGMAFRAPVLAALFLIVTFATLAMPGSANFVGELLVLFGTFEDQLVYGLVASAGVVLAAVYMIRALPAHDARTRRADGRVARDRRAAPGGDRAAGRGDRRARPLPALRGRPHRARDRERDPGRARRRAAGGRAMMLPLADVQAPAIDYKELSPLLATLGGSIVVLMVGLLRGPFVQRVLVPALTAVSLLHRDRAGDLGLGAGRAAADHRGLADGGHAGARGVDAVLRRRASSAWRCRCGRRPRARPATASTTRCCSARSRAWCCWPPRPT